MRKTFLQLWVESLKTEQSGAENSAPLCIVF